ncbi:unnamed protein product [Urochloa humidicola]
MVFPGSSASAAAPSLGFPVTEKLAKNNFQLWKAQVLSALRGAQMAGFIDSSAAPPPKMVPKADKPDEQVPNPEYDLWNARDQQILNYLLSSLSREILA